MHTIKLKRAFTLLIIFLFSFYGIWLPQGKAENASITEDFQQIPDNNSNKKETEYFVETGGLSPEKSLQTLEEENLQKKPLDEEYQSVIVRKGISFNDKEKNAYSFVFSRLLFTTASIVERLQGEKETQVNTLDTKSHQTITQKNDSITPVVKEERYVPNELPINNDQQSIVREKEISSSDTGIDISQDMLAQTSSVMSASETPSSSEEDGTQTSVIDKKLSLDMIGEKIPDSHTGDGKNPQENLSVNEDDQKIAVGKEIPSATPLITLSGTSSDEGTSSIEKESGDEALAVDTKQQVSTPGDETISSLEEEKSSINHQVNIDARESRDMREKELPSITSTEIPPTSSPNEEKSLVKDGEDKCLQDTPEQDTIEKDAPSSSIILNKPSNKIEVESPVPLNRNAQEFHKEIHLQKPSGEIAEGKEETESTWKIWHSDPTHSVILAVVITLVAAKIGGWIARMIRLPGVVGKLILGMILGNFYLVTGSDYFDFLKTMPFLKMVSYFGTLVLLLTAGLTTDLRAILRVGASSFLVCLGGIVMPAGLGIIVGYFLLPDTSDGTKLLLAIILCNSSTGLLLAILSELKAMNTLEGRVIAGATILTDIVIILTFGVVSGVVAKGGVSLLGISISFGIAICFLVAAVVIIFKYGEKFGNFLTKRLTEGINIPIVVILSLLLAFMFGSVGLHTVIGAFIAGLFLRNVKLKDSDDREHRNVESFIRPFYVILVPMLFVRVGAQVDLKSFFNIEAVLLGLAITGAAIVGKMFCSVCPIEKGINRLAIGIGMATKMEGTLILTGIGRDIGILDDTVFSSVIMVIVLTSTICPFFMRVLLLRKNNIRYESICINAEKKELEKVTVN